MAVTLSPYLWYTILELCLTPYYDHAQSSERKSIYKMAPPLKHHVNSKRKIIPYMKFNRNNNNLCICYIKNGLEYLIIIKCV